MKNGKHEQVGTEEEFTPSKVDGAYNQETYYANFVEGDAVQLKYEVSTLHAAAGEEQSGGYVVPTEEFVKPVKGTAVGSYAHANPGYKFLR